MRKWRFYLQKNSSLPGQRKTPASVAGATPGARRDVLHHFVGDKRDLISFMDEDESRLQNSAHILGWNELINNNQSVYDNGLQ